MRYDGSTLQSSPLVCRSNGQRARVAWDWRVAKNIEGSGSFEYYSHCCSYPSSFVVAWLLPRFSRHLSSHFAAANSARSFIVSPSYLGTALGRGHQFRLPSFKKDLSSLSSTSSSSPKDASKSHRSCRRFASTGCSPACSRWQHWRRDGPAWCRSWSDGKDHSHGSR